MSHYLNSTEEKKAIAEDIEVYIIIIQNGLFSVVFTPSSNQYTPLAFKALSSANLAVRLLTCKKTVCYSILTLQYIHPHSQALDG